MHIKSIKIKNFRAIADVEATLSKTGNVIVGPNATGKTTILEAIRLAKALTAPRTQAEAGQILNALGVTSPHAPNRLALDVVATDPKLPIHIRCIYALSSEEFAVLKEKASTYDMATQLMLSGMGRQFTNAADLIGLLSTPLGQQNHETHIRTLTSLISDIEAGSKECVLDVTLNPATGQVTTSDPMSGTLIAFLDRRLPPYKTVFSYFPADRAIPYQDQVIQIGIHDAGNQMESHNSQPQLKYQRLKNTIFGAVIAGRGEEQADQFKAIFSRILRGKSLKIVGVNETGALKILIQDDESKKEFSIDAMSSGEKGLLLTFLLIAQSLERGGVVLLDEPELHLNPAVCREVITFLIDEYAIPNDLQVILCSHSPEVLSVAFERDDCDLFHLISGNLLTLVRRQDLEEVEGALRRLGASPAESLLYKGTVFVEGDSDSEVLEEGFSQLFQRYRLRELGGRRNVEQEILALQEQEKTVKQMSSSFFILDHDGKPTKLRSSKQVKILQWGRRCLENYLLDVNVLTDLVKSESVAGRPITNVAALQQTLKRLAYAQIDEIAARQVYEESALPNTSLTNKEMRGKTFTEFADILFERIQKVQQHLALFEPNQWKAQFIAACESRKAQLEERWQTAWETECDGKKLLRDFHAEVAVRDSIVRFKIRVINAMATNRSENWLAMHSLLNALMGAANS